VQFEGIAQGDLACGASEAKDLIALKRAHGPLRPPGVMSGARERAIAQSVGGGSSASSARCDPTGGGGQPVLRAMRERDTIKVIQHYAWSTASMDMDKRSPRTTLSIPPRLRYDAKVKAAMLDVSLSSVVRELLERWVAGEIRIGAEQAADRD
jgi:hypothetical protein